MQGEQYRASSTVRARRLEEELAWHSGGGSPLRGEVGDWVLEADGSQWTVEDAIFTSTYAHVADDRWQKVGLVRAVCVTEATAVETPEGIAHAAPGDWLLASDEAGAWPVDEATFASRYTRVTVAR